MVKLFKTLNFYYIFNICKFFMIWNYLIVPEKLVVWGEGGGDLCV